MKARMTGAGFAALLLIFSLFATISVSTVTAAGPEVYVNPALTEDLCPGDTFTVTVEVDSDTFNLRAVQLDLVYDTTKFQVNGATVEDDLFGAGNYLDLSDLTDDGELNLAIASTNPPYGPESGTLVTVEFEVKAGVPDNTYALDLQNVVLKDENNDDIPGVTVTDGAAEVDCGAPPAGPEVYVNPALTEDLCPGDTFTVTVEVDSDTFNLRAVSLDLVYNPAVLQVNTITENGLFASYLTEPGSGDDGAGRIHYGMSSTEGTYTPSAGTFITVEFEVLPGAPDATYALDLQNVVLKDENNDDIPGVTVTDGAAEVYCVDNPPIPDITEPADGAELCPDDQVTISVVDLSGEGDIVSTVIEYYYDADCNGVADDGNSWIEITSPWDTTGLNPGCYLIRATMEDDIGQTGEDQIGVEILPCCDADFVLYLEAGWNLVSVPKPILPFGVDAATLFDLVPGETASYYDASTASWINDGDIIVAPCQGYWVYKVAPEAICIYYDRSVLIPPVQELYPGWNMIGHIDDTVWSVEDFVVATGLSNVCCEDKATMIATLEEQGMAPTDVRLVYNYPAAPGISEFDSMTPGYGYWAFLTEEHLMPGTTA